MESVIQDTPIGQAIKNMCDEDKNICSVFFNSAHYLAKQEQPFFDFPNLLYLHKKNKTPSCYINATEIIVLLEILQTPLVKVRSEILIVNLQTVNILAY